MKAPLQAPKSFGSAASPAPAQRKSGLKTIVDNRPTAVAQRKLQGMVNAQSQLDAKGGIIQRVLYQGVRTDKEYHNAVARGKYTAKEIKAFIDADEEYVYNKATGEVMLKRPIKRLKTEHTDSSNELAGWVKTVDKGVDSYNAPNTREEIKFVAREKLDNNINGAGVGTNNIAYFGGMTETHEIKMSKNQSAINYYTSFVKNDMEDQYERSTDKKVEKSNRKKRRDEVGPEIQQIIGWEGDELRTNIGGNSDHAQGLIREEFLDSKSDINTLGTHHKRKYRSKTVKQASKRMHQHIASNPDIKKHLLSMIDNEESEHKTTKKLKKLIGSAYKDSDLKKLYKLRNALKVPYGKLRLENANITVPGNKKNIHSESNLLDSLTDTFVIKDVMGTKVPCVACFTKFCKNGQHEHLLQYTSFVWFSKSCMTQLGCDYSAKTAEEVVNYLEKIHEQMGSLVGKVKKYTGKMGDIKPDFSDEDSDSMGEESRKKVVRKLKRKREAELV